MLIPIIFGLADLNYW